MEIQNIQKQNYEFIDYLKFFLAVVVINAHTKPLLNCPYEWLLTIISFVNELTNPFFFLAAGFFFGRGIIGITVQSDKTNYMKKYLYKLIKLYCIYSVVYFPLAVYGYWITGKSGVIRFIASYLKYFFLVGGHYGSNHLWFLLSLIYSIIFLYFYDKFGWKREFLWLIALLSWVFCQWIDYVIQFPACVHPIVNKFIEIYKFSFNGPGIFRGLCFVILGYLFVKTEWNKIAMLCFFGVLAVVWFWGQNTPVAMLIKALAPISLFSYAIQVRLLGRKKGYWFRKMSTHLYFLHMLVFSFYTIVILKEPNKRGLDSFCVALLVTFIMGCVIEYFKSVQRKSR